MAALVTDKTAFQMTRETLKHAAMGGCFLGSGGGGTLQSALRFIENFKIGGYYSQDTVDVVKVEDATDGDGVVVAYIGAPAKINRADYPDGPVQAVLQIQNRLREKGRRLAYIVPAETGALGFTVACLVAAKLGLKVVDADGAGRAVPSLPQLTFSITEGLSPNPAVVVNQDKNLCIELGVTLLPGISNDGSPVANQTSRPATIQDVSGIIDHLMRPIISEPDFDQFGGLALWIMNHEQMLKALPIRHTLSRVCTLGAKFATFTGNSNELVKFLNEDMRIPARRIFGPGRIASLKFDTKDGFDFGFVTIEGEQWGYCGVLFQNESLMAQMISDIIPLCTAPDNIAFFLEPSEHHPHQLGVFSNGDLVTDKGTLREDLVGRKFSIICTAGDDILWNQNEGIYKSFQEMLHPWTSTLTPFERG